MNQFVIQAIHLFKLTVTAPAPLNTSPHFDGGSWVGNNTLSETDSSKWNVSSFRRAENFEKFREHC
jgi:hypothetical protein